MSGDRRLPLASKLFFGLGQSAEGLKNTSFNLFVLFFYNQVLGVPGSLCGLALGIALLFDAVTDPLAGSLSDNWRSRWGRRHPFLVASALPMGLAFFGLFSPPTLGPTGLAVWLGVFAVLTRGAMTLYHVPHMALGAELSESFEERTSIVAWRQGFGYLGGLGVVALGFGVFFSDARGGRLVVESYSSFALAVGAAMSASVLLCAWGTRREIPHLPPARAPETALRRRVLPRLREETRSAFGNASFRWLFGGVLMIYVMVGMESALALYMYEFFWELSGPEILWLSLVYPIGLISGAPLTPILHRLFDKRPALVLGTAGWALCQVLPVLLRLLHELPDNGGAALLPILLGFRFAQGLLVQQALVSFGSMMADVVDEHELSSGRRQEGIFFGAVSFSGKAASGVGSLLAGLSLDWIAWPAGTASVAEETVTRLGWLYGPALAGFAVAAIASYARYGLTRQRHREILTALRDRGQRER